MGVCMRQVEIPGSRVWPSRDVLLFYLLCAVQDVPQLSTGFPPFELLYVKQPFGVLDLLHKTWQAQGTKAQNGIQYITKLWNVIGPSGGLCQGNIRDGQKIQKQHYSMNVQLWAYQALLLLPSSESKLLAK